MKGNTSYQTGDDAQVDDDVVLGYCYRADCQPLEIGDHAIIRSGTIIYADTKIGPRFQCGHQVLIRAEVTIGDRCVVHHKCTLEGCLRIGNGVKIMAQVYLPSTTEIGNMVFIGPGTTFLNDKYPMRRATRVSGPRIEDQVSIGGCVTVCPEITIGRNSVIGAGSVVNNDVPPNHQDSAYFTIQPLSLVTCWIALDDVTLENGCMWVIPRSHHGELHDHSQPWDIGGRIDMQVPDEKIDRSRETPITLSAGSCSFHHSMLLHRSGPNQTESHRRGLAIHYMSSQSRWTNPNLSQPTYPLLRGREYSGCV